MANWYVWRAVLTACIGATLAGLHIGSINGMFEMHGFQSIFPENFEQSDRCTVDPNEGTLYAEFDNVTAACGICTSVRPCDRSGTKAGVVLGLMVSVSTMFAIFGSILGAWTSNPLGRRTVLSISGWIMATGALLSAASFHSWLFILGRGISGFSYGLTFSVLATYISEMSPSRSRGRLVALIGPVFGIFLVIQFSANCGFTRFCTGWRVSISLQIAAGVAYGVLMLLVPRTPRWLVLHNRISEAQIILSRIIGLPVNDTTVLATLKELESTTAKLSNNYRKNLAQQLRVVMKWKYLKRLLLCCSLFLCLPLIGNFTNSYGTTFLCKINISGCTANIIVGIFSSIGGSVMSILLDRVGRKTIMLVGSILMLVLLGLMVTLIQVFNLEEENNLVVGIIFTVLLCLFAFVYTGSWLNSICSIFGIVLSVCCYNSSNYLLFISSSLGIVGFLYLVIGATILAFLIVLLAVPETKGVTLERMDELFEKPWLERVNIKFYLSCGISSFCQNITTEEKLNTIINSDCNTSVKVGASQC